MVDPSATPQDDMDVPLQDDMEGCVILNSHVILSEARSAESKDP